MTITKFGIFCIYCTHELYQMFGNAPKFAVFPCCPGRETAPVLQALLFGYICGQQLQHREARGKNKRTIIHE